MAVNTDYIKLLFPELSGVVDEQEDRVKAYIDIAATRVNRCVFGSKADYAHALMTAHMLVSLGLSAVATEGGGGAGPVTSEKIGDLAVSYGDLTSNESFNGFGTTKYGIEFINLQRSVLKGPMLT